MLIKKNILKILQINFAHDSKVRTVNFYFLNNLIDPKEWINASFCLTLIPYNEKGIRKLLEHFDNYRDKLTDP